NLPKDSLEKAIKRGTGELEGQSFEEMTIEGYGPGGVGVLVELLTDNKNRTSAEIRSLFTKHGGNLAGAGSVSWLFHKKGQILLNAKSSDEDRLMESVLESGGEDVAVDNGQATVTSDPQTFEAVKEALQKAGFTWESADLTMVPSSTVRVDNA